jgi:hypothetical protein
MDLVICWVCDEPIEKGAAIVKLDTGEPAHSFCRLVIKKAQEAEEE